MTPPPTQIEKKDGEKIKVLNLYAGIGGNRKLWPNDQIEVTAVEINPEIAKIYQDFFPNDKVIVGDAHQYLLEHYKEFDFIWSSRPCTSHSLLRLSHPESVMYADLGLYEEIILLRQWFKGLWCVENVEPYYVPLYRPTCQLDRHFFWTNFEIDLFDMCAATKDVSRDDVEGLSKFKGIDLSNCEINDKRKLLRNAVHPKLGLHVFNCAFKTKQVQLTEMI